MQCVIDERLQNTFSDTQTHLSWRSLKDEGKMTICHENDPVHKEKVKVEDRVKKDRKDKKCMHRLNT